MIEIIKEQVYKKSLCMCVRKREEDRTTETFVRAGAVHDFSWGQACRRHHMKFSHRLFTWFEYLF